MFEFVHNMKPWHWWYVGFISCGVIVLAAVQVAIWRVNKRLDELRAQEILHKAFKRAAKEGAPR